MRALCAEGPRYSHGLKPPFRERGGEERVFKEQHGLALHKCRHLRALPLAVAEVQELSPSRTAGLREVYATVRFAVLPGLIGALTLLNALASQKLPLKVASQKEHAEVSRYRLSRR